MFKTYIRAARVINQVGVRRPVRRGRVAPTCHHHHRAPRSSPAGGRQTQSRPTPRSGTQRGPPTLLPLQDLAHVTVLGLYLFRGGGVAPCRRRRRATVGVVQHVDGEPRPITRGIQIIRHRRRRTNIRVGDGYCHAQPRVRQQSCRGEVHALSLRLAPSTAQTTCVFFASPARIGRCASSSTVAKAPASTRPAAG